MIKVTGEEVKEIINTSLTEEQVEPFIDVAHALLEQYLGSETSLSEVLLKEIERWLAAHFVAIRTPGIRSKGADGANVVYEIGYLGRGLEATRYGQQVKALDPTGLLSSIGKRKAEFKSISLGL